MKGPAGPGPGGTSPLDPAAAGWAALGVGLAYAAISAYWATGGTWLLDTVGGAFERLGHSASPAVLAALWAVVLAKTIAAGLPVVVNRGLARGHRCAVRSVAWRGSQGGASPPMDWSWPYRASPSRQACCTSAPAPIDAHSHGMPTCGTRGSSSGACSAVQERVNRHDHRDEVTFRAWEKRCPSRSRGPFPLG